eukprot:2254055-Rhodomonas_salina.2
MFEFLGKEPREPANMSSSPNEGRSIIEDRRLAPATREATPEPPPLKPPEALVLELLNDTETTGRVARPRRGGNAVRFGFQYPHTVASISIARKVPILPGAPYSLFGIRKNIIVKKIPRCPGPNVSIITVVEIFFGQNQQKILVSEYPGPGYSDSVLMFHIKKAVFPSACEYLGTKLKKSKLVAPPLEELERIPTRVRSFRTQVSPSILGYPRVPGTRGPGKQYPGLTNQSRPSGTSLTNNMTLGHPERKRKISHREAHKKRDASECLLENAISKLGKRAPWIWTTISTRSDDNLQGSGKLILLLIFVILQCVVKSGYFTFGVVSEKSSQRKGGATAGVKEGSASARLRRWPLQASMTSTL